MVHEINELDATGPTSQHSPETRVGCRLAGLPWWRRTRWPAPPPAASASARPPHFGRGRALSGRHSPHLGSSSWASPSAGECSKAPTDKRREEESKQGPLKKRKRSIELYDFGRGRRMGNSLKPRFPSYRGKLMPPPLEKIID
jgi:hypothetical protein